LSKLTKASEGTDCVRCGSSGAYSCHYNGSRQHDYGKGRGIKSNDMATAELCYNCDQVFTEGSTHWQWAGKWERSEEFLHLIMLTNIRRFDKGVLKI